MSRDPLDRDDQLKTVPRDENDKDILGAPLGAHRRGWRDRGRRSPRVSKDLTTGSVRGNLWFLSWPHMVEGVLNTLDQMAHLFWAGRVVGFHAMGGLGVAQAYGQVIMMSRQGLNVAMQAMIARAFGARRIDLANHVAAQGLMLAFIVSAALSSVAIVLAGPLLRLLGVSHEIIAATLLYFQLHLVGQIVRGLMMTMGSALQASGDAITPMKATMLSRVVDLILAPFLIFGWLGLPAMGLAGAAAGNIVGQGLGMGWVLYALVAGTSRLHLTPSAFRPDLPLMWRMVRIGAPASGTQLERTISELVLVRLVTPFGDAALAAYSLVRRLERVTHFGSQGVGRASGILVAQNLGAGSVERAKSTVRWALIYVTAIKGGMSLLLVLFPVFFLTIFSADAEFLNVAVLWLQITAIALMFFGGAQVFQQSFNVAGDTMAPLLVTFMSLWVLEIPLAFVLTQFTPLGVYGVPVAIAAAHTMRLLLYGSYYFTGRWLRIQVL